MQQRACSCRKSPEWVTFRYRTENHFSCKLKELAIQNSFLATGLGLLLRHQGFVRQGFSKVGRDPTQNSSRPWHLAFPVVCF
jgi:hypothetical protein